MVALPSRHRPLMLLAAVVLAQILLLAIQIKTGDQIRLIRVWVVGVITPIQGAASWTTGKIQGAWRSYIGLRGTAQENQTLREEMNRLRLRNTELESRAAEAQRLAALLGFREAHPEIPMVAVRVIGAGASGTSRTVYVSRGESDGIKRNMVVITPDGVVGKVTEVFPGTAEVLLISDKESGVGGLLASSRTQGPVGGLGGPLLAMKYVSNEEKVQPGDAVLTSGLDRIYPKDLPLGTVVEAKPGNPFQEIRIQPAARLDRLEEVFVLLTREPSDAPSTGNKAAQKAPVRP